MKKWLLVVLSILIICVSLLIKPITRVLAIKSNSTLKGIVIVLDAGHGGFDPGARTKMIDEQSINLDICLKLKKILESAGAEVILTRDDNYDLSDNSTGSKKRDDMIKRANIMNQENVTLFLSIHCNTSFDRKCHGAEAYYRIDDEVSKQLATTILNQLRDLTDSKFLPKKGDFYLLNNTHTLGALIEVGFMTNPNDLANLQKNDYQEELAYHIYLGIQNFLQILQ